MTWAGFPLNRLLWVGGIAMLAMIGLYLLRMRRRTVAVAFSPLWDTVVRDKKSSRWLSVLRRLLSLLTQLVLLFALTLALGDLRCADSDGSARHLVVLVDTSASMGATDVGDSRLQRAKLEVGQLIASLGPSDQALIAQMDDSTTPLSSMTGELRPLHRATTQLRLSDSVANLPQAVRFALDSLNGRTRPEIVLVSDGALVEDGASNLSMALPDLQFSELHLPQLQRVALSYLPVGRASENVAITAFSVRRYPLDRSRYEVLLELVNTGDELAELEVSLWGDDKIVHSASLQLDAHETIRKVYRQLTGVDRKLVAKLRVEKGQDWLAVDNQAYAVLPARRRARVLVVGEPNAYLEAALLLDEYLEVVAVGADQVLPPGQFDTTIFDGVARPVQARLGSLLYLGMPEAAGDAAVDLPVAASAAIEQFGFDKIKAKSPLFRWIEPANIQVLRGHSLIPQPGDQVVGASEKGPILVSGQREGQKFVFLGFNPRDSDFVLRAGWPLFVLNVLHYFAEAEGDYLTSLRTGARGSLPVPVQNGAMQLTRPDGSVAQVLVSGGRVNLIARQAGFYTLSTPGAASGGESSAQLTFAVNLGSSLESQITPVPSLLLGAKRGDNDSPLAAPEGLTPAARQTFWGWLLTFGLVLGALEWLSFHRRWTV